MIDGVRGLLISAKDDSVIVETGGFSLAILVPVPVCNTMNQLLTAPGSSPEVTLSTHLSVRPESWQLYGFRDSAQRNLFRILLGIPGIGPRLALSLLSHLNWQEMRAAIEGGDHSRFLAVPGIGKRTAARIIVELSGKIEGGPESELPAGDGVIDAADALCALGVPRSEALNLVRVIVQETGPTDDSSSLVAEALRRRSTS